ncbi:MAG: chlorophyll synthesis pathway protein BchC [Anaerolineales bacterium]|nr:chlorophyll synthesis pathway protein BchC [Anaerolineales bacterium]MCB9127100.1 chlorophyll synthesis pathway protein BchC [Ardenticatenales bacterium]
MRSQAVVISEPGHVELREVALNRPGPDDLLIETAFTSISAGTERMLLAGQMPHPMLSLPVVPGYETVGRVAEVGANVPAEWAGQWVYIGGALCYDGLNAAWGGQSQRLFAPQSRTIPLDGVAPEQGVLLALTATALHGIDLLSLQGGERLLVLGQGPVGQLAARLAQRQGAVVTVADRIASRLARSVAESVINVSAQPLNEQITAPVDIIVEASGSMAALAEALPLLNSNGTILLLGYYQTLNLPYMPLFLKQARLLTAKEWAANDLQRSRDLIASGALEVGSLLTHRMPVTQIEAAYETALNDPDCLKLVLEWETL